MRLGADSGGTFTDLVGTSGPLLKIPSTPSDPGAAVHEGIAQAAGGAVVDVLAHGTTVATNALLEGDGAPVALVSTEGLADLIEIARQSRPSLYDPWADRPVPLVPRGLRIEIAERVGPDGAVMTPLDLAGLDSIPDGVDAVAVCLLHADLWPEHETAVAAALRERGFDVSASHEVAPEFREYERTVTTVVNASLRPICRPYLDGLEGAAATVAVMTSGGGLVDLRTASATPASLLLSGPAAGVRAAAEVAGACGRPDAISFDMGGTSTDVCLILGGRPAPAAMRRIAGYPIRLPSLDVHTIGAGGGSIASVDPGGALLVGPESAGARPGPACYGLGGAAPTVTDAHVALGRIPPSTDLPGLGPVDVAAARESLSASGVSAQGVIDVVNANMEQALRAVSVERGVDPASLALVAFGGAGPLHACELAAAVGISSVIVPAAAGVLSAVGLLMSPVRRELVQSWRDPLDHRAVEAASRDLGEQAIELVRSDPMCTDGSIQVSTAVDCRYRGQSHELRVPKVADFAAEHRARNGYASDGAPVEVTAIRAVATGSAPATLDEVLAGRGVSAEGPVSGPGVVVRDDCTVWIPDGWVGRPGALGALVLTREVS